ncbi:MAG: CapA family protein [Clostridia bacterium]|nr:CapA family protein [Clostridia bacterium]
MATLKFSAAGDAMVFRRLPGAYEGFKDVQDYIGRADFKFVNLETTIHNFETYGGGTSGGSWFCAPPGVLEDLKTFGFNMLSTANNHALDYSHAGLLKTLEYIEASGLTYTGTGRTLSDASRPVYLDTLNGRIALIAACTTFNPGDSAGEQTRMLPGRPGLNTNENKKIYELPKEEMDKLREIAALVPVNADQAIYEAQGYRKPFPPNEFGFGPLRFVEADAPAERSFVDERDMQRMIRSINEAKFAADYIVVAIHSHQNKGLTEDEPAEFYVDMAHRLIDAGANAVVGTGTHHLRAMEIYNGCPIFYALGDFIIQLETLQKAPAGMYEKQGLTGNEGIDVMFNRRSDNGKKGLYYDKQMFQTVVPYWEVEDGKLTKLDLLPVELNFDAPKSMGGWPRPKFDEGILEKLAELSEPFGTKIRIEDGIGHVEL